MLNPNEDPTNTYEYEPPKLTIKKQLQHQHHPSKPFKNIYRSSFYKSYKYADIGFTITKQNKKYVAHCKVCNRTLGNTAYARLKGHRNICKVASMENSPECPSLYPSPSTNEIYNTKQNDIPSLECVSQYNTKQNDIPSQEFVSQTSTNDNSRLTINEVYSKIEQVESEPSGNLPPYCNSDQESQLLNEENQLKLNIIEVLLPIKYNKKILFEENTKRSTDMWMEILKKAQALGLAPTGVPWNYARDSLYSAWRLHTHQKKDAIESGEMNVKYNIVDISILQIENAPMSSDNLSFENENLYETANNSIFDMTIEDTQLSKNNHCPGVENKNSIAIQTTDEMYKADLRLKLLQCEAQEIENYKHSLETLELERKLQIPNSRFAAKYFPTMQNSSNQRTWDDTNIMVKIELDD